MAEIHAVTRERHGNLRWHKPVNFSAFARDTVVVLASHELAKAMQALPVAFMMKEELCLPVAVLGLQAEQNLFVAADGSWLGKYIPLQYRTHPFRLLRRSEQEDYILCINEAQANLTGSGPGEPFFGDDGKPAPAVGDITNQLMHFEKDRTVSRRRYEQLKQLELVEPWPIKVQKPDGSETGLAGLYRVNETRLRELSGEEMVALRDTGAFMVLYAQLLSMQNLMVLGELAARQMRPEPQQATSAQFGDNGLISFDNLR